MENPLAPKEDPALKITHFSRTLEEMKMLGLLADDATEIPEELKMVSVSLGDVAP